MSKHYDVIIVGAGVQGLSAAHTFLAIDASLDVLILDSKATLGGVWAKEQLYPGLRANSLQGYYEFSDYPILEAGLESYGVGPRSILSGDAVHAYLQKFAEHFNLAEKMRLNTTVLCALNNEADAINAWALDITTSGTEERLTCSKLIIATGQASKPLLPVFPGADTFTKPIIHSVRLGEISKSIIPDPAVEHVTIIGGSKSAHDAVFMLATAGKRVTWLTRRSGRGTMPMANIYSQIGPFKIWLEGLLMTRSQSWFHPTPWGDGDGFGWIRWFLEKTAVGRSIVNGYFDGMSKSSAEQSGIMNDERTKGLAPDTTLMWYGTQASSLNYANDIYEVIKDKNVEIVRQDLDRLEGDTLILQNGQIIKTDTIIACTGYDYGPTFPLQPSESLVSWGVPVPPSHDNVFPDLDGKADIELLERFPILVSSPSSIERQPGRTSWRLWRFIAPPSQVSSKTRSLAFLSTIGSYQTTLKCELVSLWAYAYFNHELHIKTPAEQDVFYEAALWSRYGKWRVPMGMQGKATDLMLDAMPYYDLLLRDLGLRSWRKGWGIFGEVFGRWYEVKDYRGIIDEYIAKRQGEQKKQV